MNGSSRHVCPGGECSQGPADSSGEEVGAGLSGVRRRMVAGGEEERGGPGQRSTVTRTDAGSFWVQMDPLLASGAWARPVCTNRERVGETRFFLTCWGQ